MLPPGMYDGGDALPEGYGLSVFDVGGQYEELRAKMERRTARQERSAAAYDYSTTPMFQGRRADPSRLVPVAPPGSEMVAGEQPTSPLVYVAAAGMAAVALYLLFKK